MFSDLSLHLLVCLFLKEKVVVCAFLQLFLMDKANLLMVEFMLSCCGSWELAAQWGDLVCHMCGCIHNLFCIHRLLQISHWGCLLWLVNWFGLVSISVCKAYWLIQIPSSEKLEFRGKLITDTRRWKLNPR